MSLQSCRVLTFLIWLSLALMACQFLVGYDGHLWTLTWVVLEMLFFAVLAWFLGLDKGERPRVL